MPDRFDKFTERARRVLVYAHEDAQRRGHDYMGTEHLLLALVRDEAATGARVLADLGVGLDDLRGTAGSVLDSGARAATSAEIGLTSRAKKVIELAVDEARALNHSYIGTEHLLLGLVREGEGVLPGVIEGLGHDVDRVRRTALDLARDVRRDEPHSHPESRPGRPPEATGTLRLTSATAEARTAAADKVRAARDALEASAGAETRPLVDLLLPELARLAELMATEHTRMETFLQSLGESAALRRLLRRAQRLFGDAGEQAAADALRDADEALASAFPVPGVQQTG